MGGSNSREKGSSG
jgi:hypothetical protein